MYDTLSRKRINPNNSNLTSQQSTEPTVRKYPVTIDNEYFKVSLKMIPFKIEQQ